MYVMRTHSSPIGPAQSPPRIIRLQTFIRTRHNNITQRDRQNMHMRDVSDGTPIDHVHLYESGIIRSKISDQLYYIIRSDRAYLYIYINIVVKYSRRPPF